MKRSYHSFRSNHHHCLLLNLLHLDLLASMFHSHHDGIMINFDWICKAKNNDNEWVEWTDIVKMNNQNSHLTYLSRFFIDKLRSTFSIRLSNQCAIVCCLSNGWDRMMFSFNDLYIRSKKNFVNIVQHQGFWMGKVLWNENCTWNNLRTVKSNQAMVVIMTIDSYNLQT